MSTFPCLYVCLFLSIVSGIAADTNNPPQKRRWLDAFKSSNTNKPVKMPGDMRFSEYTGADSLEWEVSIGALADTSYELPVYRGWPSRAYAVVGDIRHKDSRKDWQEGEIRDAIKGAKRLRADAIVIKLTSESGVGAVTGTIGKGTAKGSIAHYETTALVIRWQTEAEVQKRAERDAHLRKQLLVAKPNLDVNSQTAALAIKYLLQSGARENAAEFYDKYEQTMMRISPQSMGDLSGEWLFKAIIKEKGIVSESEDQFLGMASVRAEGENVAIVSTAGKVEMSFSGQNVKGRLNGQVGIAGISTASQGVALDDKISLTYQTLTPKGIAQGTVVLQRNRIIAPKDVKPKL